MKTAFVAYDHGSLATGFHLRIVVGGNPRLIPTASVASFKCRVEPTVKNVPVSDAGGVNIHQAFAPRRSRPRIRSGNFIVNAQFLSPTELSGTYQVTKPGCDSGVRPFTASAGGEHVEHELRPDVAGATPAQRAQAEALLAASKQAAARFPTIEAAFQAGYVPSVKNRVLTFRGPTFFHVENCENWVDGHVLDPNFPESLVYWYPPDLRPVLIAFMYRLSRYQPAPPTGGPVVRWHGHGGGPTQMTHVWFANSLEDAFAPLSHPPAALFSNPAPPQQGVVAGPLEAQLTPHYYYNGRGYCLRRGRPTVSRSVRLGVDSFKPRAVTIRPGASVTWRWKGRRMHHVVAAGQESFRSQIGSSGKYRHRFFWPGRTRITCGIHPRMRMTVIVRP